MVAEIVLNSVTKATDKIYHYIIPEHFSDIIAVGMRVLVNFGHGNAQKEGYVVGITDKSDFSSLKPIVDIIDNEIYFSDKEVRLCKFMHHRYFCSYASSLKAMLPAKIGTKFKRLIFLEQILTDCDVVNSSLINKSIVEELKKCSPLSEEQLLSFISRTNISANLKKLQKEGIIRIETEKSEKISDSYSTYISLCIERDRAYELCDALSKRAPAMSRALEVLGDCHSLALSELIELADVSKPSVDNLVKKGYAIYTKNVVRKDLFADYEVLEYTKKILNESQTEAVNKISSSIENDISETYLLHGVTGSGKTEVYLELIEKTLDRGKQALFLVPEISLTPQMVSQVVSRFSGRVAVLHSSLTQKERYNEWKKIKEGSVDVAVGARSAIFAPFDNLGLIIIDEEHENTYKSETTPRYNACEIARFRSKEDNAVLLLASATPSIESYYKCKTGKYTLIEMPSRIGNTPLPDVTIVDMKKELEKGNMSIFSKTLTDKIKENIKNKKQTILFLNRRGYSNFVSCRSCGYVVKCPHCNVSMTYHKSMDKMICHYCDYMQNVPKVCPDCMSKYIKYFGSGTQRVIETIEQTFPDATYLRMDADTTMVRDSHEKILKKFRDENIDILVGTQMVTKGLDFENVTLVGVLSADMSLNQEDYRASERTFDLITQVCGRSGRGKYKGEAVIQTYCPNDETILLSAKQDYKGFFENEIQFRKLLTYPPFCEFINITFTDSLENCAKETAQRFYVDFTKAVKAEKLNEYIECFPPTEAPIHYINDKFRYRILSKSRYNEKLYELLGNLYRNYVKKKNNAGIIIDVNPQSLY